MKLRKSMLVAALGLACGIPSVTIGQASSAGAGGVKVLFPDGYEKHTLYSVLDRHDTKQYRELYASPGVVEAVRKGLGVPDGAVLTLVQFKAKVDEKGNPLRVPAAAS